MEFRVPDEVLASHGRRRRKFYRDCADKVEAGEELSRTERMSIAAALQEHALTIPLKRKRGPGQEPMFDHAFAAFTFIYMTLRKDGKQWSETKALNRLAEKYGVKVSAMRKAVNKHKDEAREYVFLLARRSRGEPDDIDDE